MSVNGIRFLAHRGGALTSAENTLEAFARSREFGVDGIECDVRLTADGEPVLFHDEDTRRLTGSSGKIAAMAWTQARRLRVLGRHRIPHLEEALHFVAAWPGAELYIDLHEDRLELVEAVVRRLGVSDLMDRCYVLDFYKRRHLLLHARRLDPAVRIAAMPGAPWNTRACVEALQARSLCLGWDGPATRLLYRAACLLYDVRPAIADAVEAGVEVSGGVANSPQEVRYFLRQGVKGIWTDDLEMALRELQK